MIRFLTAGESHGRCLTLIMEGIPAGLQISAQDIDRELKRRQMGYGRGARMKIESDKAEITAGIRTGVTLGSPIAVTIQNRDWENWREVMSPQALEKLDQNDSNLTPSNTRQALEKLDQKNSDLPQANTRQALEKLDQRNSDLASPNMRDQKGSNLLQVNTREGGSRDLHTWRSREVTRPRPGHADLAGGIKYHHRDLRDVLERASARETAARVAGGAIAKRLLAEFDIHIASFVIQIGDCSVAAGNLPASLSEFREVQEQLESSPLRCPDADAEKRMMEAIDAARDKGDSLGGIFQIMAFNVPPGLGSHVHWDRRLDARIACAVMSIPAIKGVEIGLGFEASRRVGSQVHDEIYYEGGRGFYRKTNNAGGTEGGISNGEAIVAKAAMKPIPTLSRPLNSVDFISKEAFQASKERADVCAVPAAGVVGEAVVAIEIANALLEKFGGDSMSELKCNFEAYMDYVSGL